MGYTAREQSDYEGHPLELYRFSMGETQWLYTSADHEIEKEGDKYIPTYIKRGEITRTGDARKSTIEIEVAASNPLPLLFRNGWSAGSMVLTIYRHHYGDSEFSVLWKGRVIGNKWVGSRAVLLSDSVFTMFKRSGLRRAFQVGCPHILYGTGRGACNVVKDSYKVTGTAAAVAGNVVTVAAAGGYAPGYFTGGMCKTGDSVMLIMGHSGTSVVLLDAVPGMAEGAGVELWPGCDHSLATCTSKFNNAINYGGLPFLPTKNPFSGDALV